MVAPHPQRLLSKHRRETLMAKSSKDNKPNIVVI
jgi:hypothetical protein